MNQYTFDDMSTTQYDIIRRLRTPQQHFEHYDFLIKVRSLFPSLVVYPEQFSLIRNRFLYIATQDFDSSYSYVTYKKVDKRFHFSFLAETDPEPTLDELIEREERVDDINIIGRELLINTVHFPFGDLYYTRGLIELHFTKLSEVAEFRKKSKYWLQTNYPECFKR